MISLYTEDYWFLGKYATYLVFKELVFQCFVTWIIPGLFKQNTIFLQTPANVHS